LQLGFYSQVYAILLAPIVLLVINQHNVLAATLSLLLDQIEGVANAQ
jgi:hypothetical protein